MNDNVTELNVVMARRERAQANMNRAQRFIWVTFQREGFHQYPAAGTNPALEDVGFLQYRHRHIFHFKIHIEVTHNDRDIEFIQFKRWCESLFSSEGCLSLDSKSCEMIADDLYAQIAVKYPNRDVTIEVAEDNENGCRIVYNDTINQTIKA